MPKRAPNQWRQWSDTHKLIGHKLQAYYQACMTEELPPRLLAALKKLDEETEAETAALVRRSNAELFHRAMPTVRR